MLRDPLHVPFASAAHSLIQTCQDVNIALQMGIHYQSKSTQQALELQRLHTRHSEELRGAQDRHARELAAESEARGKAERERNETLDRMEALILKHNEEVASITKNFQQCDLESCERARSVAVDEFKNSEEGQSYTKGYYDSGWLMAQRCVKRVDPEFNWEPVEEVYDDEEKKARDEMKKRQREANKDLRRAN